MFENLDCLVTLTCRLSLLEVERLQETICELEEGWLEKPPKRIFVFNKLGKFPSLSRDWEIIQVNQAEVWLIVDYSSDFATATIQQWQSIQGNSDRHPYDTVSLADMLKVSQLELCDDLSEIIEQDVFRLSKYVAIAVAKADGCKCERCWRYSTAFDHNLGICNFCKYHLRL